MKRHCLTITLISLYLFGFSQVNLTTGLVAHYPLNGNANDISGNAINGTINNVSLTSDRTGAPNNAYYFSSINSFIELPYSNLYNFAPSGTFTISVWVLPDQGYSWPAQAVVVKSPPNPNYLASQWNYGTYILNYKAMGGFGGNHVLNGTTTLTSTTCWYNIVQTYDNGKWNMYVNGVLESSDITQTRFILQDGFSKIVFGKKGESDGDYYKGKMDDIRIYNRVVTSDEIAALFSENNPCRTTNQVCSGSLGTPIVNITFGSGSINPGPQIFTQIPGASTNYNFASYVSGNPPSVIFDGDYALVNGVPSNPAWYTGASDHTGNANGYMAFFNSAPTPGEFYRQTVSGLCAGTTYEFSTWVANVINPSVLPTAILPNITFKILNPSNAALLASFNTGDIPMANAMTWRQYSFLFVAPSATNSVTLVLENNNVGGNAQPGNDLALDDITFRPCGPLVNASLNTPTVCYGQSINLSGSVTGLLNNPAYQWQISSDAGNTFTNIAGASSLNHTLTSLAPGNYKVQLLAGESANINSSTCRFISNILDITIVQTPATPAFTVTQPNCSANTGIITITSPSGTGLEYSLNGVTYQSSPVFSNLAQGVYDLRVRNTQGNCISSIVPITINAPLATPTTPSIAPIIQPNCITATGSFTVNTPIAPNLQYSINGTTYQSSPLFSGVAPGTYNLTVRNTTSTCVSLPAVVVINTQPPIPPDPTLSITQPTCILKTGAIQVTVPTGSQLEYSLNGGAYQLSPLFNLLSPGNYQVTVRNTANGCISSPSNAIINQIPQPPVSPVVGVILQPTCDRPTGNFQVSLPLGNNLQYSIDGVNFQTSPIFSNIAPGTYSLSASIINTGCTSAPVTVTINSLPSPPTSPSVTVTQQPNCNIATGSILITNPTGSNLEYSVNGVIYQASQVFSSLDTGSYQITVRDRVNGCTSSPAFVKISPDIAVAGKYFIPNAFTPNGDGLNDCFGIKNWGIISEFRLMIYNRWGEEVFFTTNPFKCWDGNYKKLPAVPGNYVYYIKAISLCGIIERKGNFALIR